MGFIKYLRKCSTPDCCCCPPTTKDLALVVSGTTICAPSLGVIDGTYALAWSAADQSWECIAAIGPGTIKLVFQCGPTLVLGGAGFIIAASVDSGSPSLDFYFFAQKSGCPTNPQTVPNEFISCGDDNAIYGGNATISW